MISDSEQSPPAGTKKRSERLTVGNEKLILGIHWYAMTYFQDSPEFLEHVPKINDSIANKNAFANVFAEVFDSGELKAALKAAVPAKKTAGTRKTSPRHNSPPVPPVPCKEELEAESEESENTKTLPPESSYKQKAEVVLDATPKKKTAATKKAAATVAEADTVPKKKAAATKKAAAEETDPAPKKKPAPRKKKNSDPEPEAEQKPTPTPVSDSDSDAEHVVQVTPVTIKGRRMLHDADADEYYDAFTHIKLPVGTELLCDAEYAEELRKTLIQQFADDPHYAAPDTHAANLAHADKLAAEAGTQHEADT